MIRIAVQVVVVDQAGGRPDLREIIRIDRDQLGPETLGLSLAEAKAITGGIQQVLAGCQVAEWQQGRRACSDCGRRRALKGHHPLVFRTPFGVMMRLDSERVRICRCAERPTGSVSPLADLLRERVIPADEKLDSLGDSRIGADPILCGLTRFAQGHADGQADRGYPNGVFRRRAA